MDRDWKMITIPNWDFIRQTIEHFNLKISGLDVDQYFSNDVKIELLREIHHKQTVFRVIKGPEKTGVIRKPYDDFAENWFRDSGRWGAYVPPPLSLSPLGVAGPF